MATWRERVSEPAQEDLDGLLDIALAIAEERLAAKREFAPFVLVVDRATGTTDTVSLPSEAGDEARALGFRAISRMRSQLRAAAVVSDVTLRATGGGAVEVLLEHAEGVALRVLEPYRIEDDEVLADDLEAHTAQQRVWNE